MRTLMILILTVGVALAFAGDCHVTCPEGYHGGCVKSGADCDCSCWKNAQDAKVGILKALQRMGASRELQERARTLLRDVEELAETSLTDQVTKRQFTILLKTSSDNSDRKYQPKLQ